MTNHHPVAQIFRMAVLLSASAGAAGIETACGDQWAILIAVQDHAYKDLNNIRFTTNDAVALKGVLMTRGGLPRTNICEVNKLGDGDHKPTATNIARNLVDFLKNPRIKPDDHVLFYFSGHGAIIKGKTYLVPADLDVNTPGEYLIPIDVVHDAVRACKAKTKLLIFDCCHAGNNNRRSLPLPSGDEIARADGDNISDAMNLDELPGCCILASCTKRESSYEWESRKHGFFTYWLCRALEGGADLNSDGRVSFDEVANYTHRQVTRSVGAVIRKRQTPVRQVGFDVLGDPVVLELLPEPPESLCRRLAEHLDLEIRAQGITKVGFLNFVTPVNNTDVLASANLPSYVADGVREQLVSIGRDAYQTVGREEVEKAADSKNVTVEQLGQGKGLDAISRELPEMEAVVWGRLDRRKQNVIVQCELLHMTDGRLASSTGVLPLSEDLLADYGASFNNVERPSGSPYAPAVIAHVESDTQVHPVQQPSFPFRVELWKVHATAGSPITAETRRTRLEYYSAPGVGGAARDVVVKANEGDIFEIRLKNLLEHPVAMVVMVDGHNSLNYARERIGRAKPWVVPPTGDTTYRVISGWTRTASSDRDHRPRRPGTIDAQISRFKFTNVESSVVGRTRFTDSIGLITVAIFAERGRALAVGEGPSEFRPLKTVQFKSGRMLGSLNIRYVDAATLESE